jgi:hypothetical protein
MDSYILPDGVWSQDFIDYPLSNYEFEYRGYECSASRTPTLQSWVGYVQLPSTHPDFGKHYSNIDVDVHGELTYSREGKIGFDCAHAYDIVPGLMALYQHFKLSVPFPSFRTYKDYAFVTKELEKLVDQLILRSTT